MLDGVIKGALGGLVASFVFPALLGERMSSVSKETRALYAGAGAVLGVFLLPSHHGFVAGVPVPATPVVTKGHFAGMSRHLHPTEDDYYRHLDRSHVGAPPPGGDYSFTRRPGYNSKDY